MAVANLSELRSKQKISAEGNTQVIDVSFLDDASLLTSISFQVCSFC